jgi:hypothetical protein
MRCKSCMNQCLDTDLRCVHCGRLLVGRDPGERRSAVAVFSAGTVTVARTSNGIQMDQAAWAGVGAVVGALFGAAVGLGLDWLYRKDDVQSALAASVPEAEPVEQD